MESDNNIIINLKDAITKLRQIDGSLQVNIGDKSKEEQESILVKEIVDYFDLILTNNFIIKENSNLPKEKNNYYYAFITKHFNTPLIRFFLLNNELLAINSSNSEQTYSAEKNWILLSILENSFSDCINEIYQQDLDKIYYKEESILRQKKSEIQKILKNLRNINFKNVKNSDFDKYTEFLKEQGISFMSDQDDFDYAESQISGKPIQVSTFSEVSIINKIEEKKKQKDENYNFHIYKNFSDSMVNNFYTFLPEQNNNEIDAPQNLDINNENLNLIEQSQDEDDSNSNTSNSDSDEDINIKSELKLNPLHYKYLPTDKLYQVKARVLLQEYDENDELIYNKKLTKMTNSHLLYLNFFYKKTLYHKFFKSSLYHDKISLKSQNYQCYICLKKFNIFANRFPLEPIFWCAYFMHFVCKNCIDNEYSVIPYFILANWSFEKFPISKKAKLILEKWYNKPIICFKKDESIIKETPIMNQVVQIKITMNYIFDKMKCPNKIKVIEEILGEYKYLVLKEIIFTIRDLVEINSKTFLIKINNFFKALVKHISGDCPQCLVEGETCKCGSDERIFFYDYKNVFYCPICNISYHRKCKGILGYMCGHE